MACHKLVMEFMLSFFSLSSMILMVIKTDTAAHVIVVYFLPSSILDVMKSAQHGWTGTKCNQCNSEFSPLSDYVFPFCMIGKCINSYVYLHNYFWTTTDYTCLYISYLRGRVFIFPGAMLTSVQLRIDCKFLPASLQWTIKQRKWKDIILWHSLSCGGLNLNVFELFRKKMFPS